MIYGDYIAPRYVLFMGVNLGKYGSTIDHSIRGNRVVEKVRGRSRCHFPLIPTEKVTTHQSVNYCPNKLLGNMPRAPTFMLMFMFISARENRFCCSLTGIAIKSYVNEDS